MFHVAGFYHELRRFDRDKHVVVNWENILPGITIDDIAFKTHGVFWSMGAPQESQILCQNNNTVISLVIIPFVFPPCNTKMHCEKLKLRYRLLNIDLELKVLELKD